MYVVKWAVSLPRKWLIELAQGDVTLICAAADHEVLT